MATYGDFQSIFQLAAGLSLGVSGLIALFEDPASRESRLIARLIKRVRSLKLRYRNVDKHIKEKITNLSDCLLDQQEKIASSGLEPNRFWWTKASSYISSLIGISLLILSSEHADQDLSIFIEILAYAVLVYVPITMLVLALSFGKQAKDMRSTRKQLDATYVSVVDAIWEKRREEEANEGKGLAIQG